MIPASYARGPEGAGAPPLGLAAGFSYSSVRWRALLVAAAVLASACCPAAAVQPDEILKDPGLEQRARGLSRELRCMVCQNQSIDDSEAPLARDLRVLVRERLTAGDTDDQVLGFLVSRYGEFVLLKPPFEWHTAILWLTPVAALVAGAIAMFAAIRRRRIAPVALAPLSPDEERRLSEVIQNGSAGGAAAAAVAPQAGARSEL